MRQSNVLDVDIKFRKTRKANTVDHLLLCVLVGWSVCLFNRSVGPCGHTLGS